MGMSLRAVTGRKTIIIIIIITNVVVVAIIMKILHEIQMFETKNHGKSLLAPVPCVRNENTSAKLYL